MKDNNVIVNITVQQDHEAWGAYYAQATTADGQGYYVPLTSREAYDSDGHICFYVSRDNQVDMVEEECPVTRVGI